MISAGLEVECRGRRSPSHVAGTVLCLDQGQHSGEGKTECKCGLKTGSKTSVPDVPFKIKNEKNKLVTVW